jgi:predicted O-methyltransferase YrrM
MAMDIESCILLSKFCRENNIVTAIELGTGVGNTTRSLLSGGTIDKLVTIDQSAKYTHYIKRFIHLDFLLPRVEAHTIPVTQFDGYKTYDLSRFSETMFDLAVIDGPESNPKGRLEAAMQLKAKYYIFRDANRDKAFIDEFISRVSPSTVEFLGTKGIVVIILDK